MNVLPVIERELRVASRRKQTYAARGAMGTLATLGVMAVLVAAEFFGMGASRAGKTVFIILGIGGCLHALFVAAGATADCLSEERRDGTLGFLFLSNLSSTEIIVGKLVANTLGVVCGLLAVLPIPALTFLLGGVTGWDFARLFFGLFNLLLFSASAGMLASTCCRESDKSTWIAMGLSAAPWVVLGIGKDVIPVWNSPVPDAAFFGAWLLASPAIAALAPLYQALPATKAGWVTAAHAMTLVWSCGFIWVSAAILRRTWRESGGIENPFTILWNRVRSWFGLGPHAFETMSRGFWADDLIEQQPTSRLMRSPRKLPAFVRLAPWVVFAGILATSTKIQWSPDKIIAGLGCAALFAHLIFRGDTAMRATKACATDRHNGALELLLTTPMTEDEILRGYVQGLKSWFLHRLAGLLIMDATVVASACVLAWITGRERLIQIVLVFMVAAGAQIIGAYGAMWNGLWSGLSAPNAARAQQKANGYVWGTAGLDIMLGIFLFAAAVNQRAPIMAPVFGVALGAVLSALLPAVFMRIETGMRMREDIRRIASLPQGTEVPKVSTWRMTRGLPQIG